MDSKEASSVPPRLLLSIDYSTKSTGWALFDLNDKTPSSLLKYGLIKPKAQGSRNFTSIRVTILKLLSIAEQLKELIEMFPTLDQIVIEEVNWGASRLGQKTLCGGHYILLNAIWDHLSKVSFKDSDGATGWRTQLGLKLTEVDKDQNRRARDINKKLQKGQKPLVIKNKKHLAQELVNRTFGLSLDVELHISDSDLADAIGLGWSCILKSKQ